MNADELKDQAQKVVADATGVAKEATDRVRDLAKQTFTQENMAAAKDKALTAASNAKDFARKTFTKDNVRAAGKVAKEELEKLKTTEGCEEAKRKAIAAWVEGKRRIVETWQGGRKGKCALIAAGTVLVLIFSSCVFSSSEDTIAGGSGGTAASRGDSAYVYDPMKMIERCQYCFYEKIRGKWEQMPPCRKGHGHSFQTIGTKGERHFGCTKCGRHYYLQYQPIGFINCPRGHACQWQEL